MSKVRTAIIGAGYWGRNLIRIFSEKSDLKWIIDVDKSVLSSYNISKTSTDFRKALEDKEVDAVIISTPPEEHFRIAKDALLAGKHVLCEKPLTENVTHADILKNVKRREKRVLMVDHTFLFTPEIMYLKKYIDDGNLGQLFYIHTSRGNLGRFQKCGALMDLAPHDISIFNHLIGSTPFQVFAYGKSFVQRDVEDIAQLIIEYLNKSVAMARLSWLDPKRVRETIIVGEEKMIIYEMGSEDPIRIYDKGVSKEYYDNVKDFSSYLLSYRHGDMLAPKIEQWEPLQAMADEFLKRCGAEEDPDDSLSGIDFSIEVVRVLSEAGRSLRVNSGRGFEVTSMYRGT